MTVVEQELVADGVLLVTMNDPTTYNSLTPGLTEGLLDVFADLSAIDGQFLVYDDGYKHRAFTYADVTRAARGFAARLANAGIRHGDKVIFWGENRPEWIACYWGAVISGVIVVPIDYRSSPDFLVRVAGIVEARLVSHRKMPEFVRGREALDAHRSFRRDENARSRCAEIGAEQAFQRTKQQG